MKIDLGIDGLGGRSVVGLSVELSLFSLCLVLCTDSRKKVKPLLAKESRELPTRGSWS